MMIPLSSIKKIAAMRNFITAIQNGSIALPADLVAVDENTIVDGITSIVIAQKVVPISYDADANVISLNTDS